MDKYAIIMTGNKQYRVQPGDVIDVELLDADENGNVEFKNVLLLQDGKKAKITSSALSGLSILGEVVGAVRGPKVIAYKYKKRDNYRRKVGHRQDYTRVKIKEFTV